MRSEFKYEASQLIKPTKSHYMPSVGTRSAKLDHISSKGVNFIKAGQIHQIARVASTLVQIQRCIQVNPL